MVVCKAPLPCRRHVPERAVKWPADSLVLIWRKPSEASKLRIYGGLRMYDPIAGQACTIDLTAVPPCSGIEELVCAEQIEQRFLPW